MDRSSAATVEFWRYVYAATLALCLLSAAALTVYAIWLVTA